MKRSATEYPTRVFLDVRNEEPIKVLHVDDEVNLLKVAKQCLELDGNFKVDTVSSVSEALKQIEKKEFDVIISDYLMPLKNGLEFLKELRERGDNIPFIIFTGRGREEIAIEALNLGADYYLNKIGHPQTVYGELEHAIFNTVKARKAEKRLQESEEKYRNLVENSKDSIVIVDFKGNIKFANKASEEITGYR